MAVHKTDIPAAFNEIVGLLEIEARTRSESAMFSPALTAVSMGHAA
jgi:hypothetical protein